MNKVTEATYRSPAEDAAYFGSIWELSTFQMGQLEKAFTEHEAALNAEEEAPVAVKPLVWTKHPNATAWRCDTIVGRYQVFAIVGGDPSWSFDGLPGQDAAGYAKDADTAKAICQSDLETRILSALTPSPNAGRVAEPAAWRHRREDGIDGWHYFGTKTVLDPGYECQPLYTQPQSQRIAELEALLQHSLVEARRYAAMYPEASDGRNTWTIYADILAKRISALSPPQDKGGV
jgi:hypothetical protein